MVPRSPAQGGCGDRTAVSSPASDDSRTVSRTGIDENASKEHEQNASPDILMTMSQIPIPDLARARGAVRVARVVRGGVVQALRRLSLAASRGFHVGLNGLSKRRCVDCWVAIKIWLDLVEQVEQAFELDQPVVDHALNVGQVLRVARAARPSSFMKRSMRCASARRRIRALAQS